MRNLDQIRAANAYRAIADAEQSTRDTSIKLPAMLQINGLLAAWAFLLAKKPAVADAVLQHLRHFQDLEIPPRKDAGDVFRHWVGDGTRGGVSGPRLRALTAEALAFSVWLKRAAEAWETSLEEPNAGVEDG